MSNNGRHHEEEALGKAYDSRLMKRLLRYLKPYRWTVVVAVGLLIVGTTLQIGQIVLVQKGIDRYIVPGDFQGFTKVALLYLAAAALVLLSSAGQLYTTMWLGQKVQHNIRTQVFNHLQKLNLSYFDKSPVGRLVTRVTNDVNTLNEMFSSGVVTIIGDILMLTLIISALLYYNWQLALLTFISLPLLVVVTFVFRAGVRSIYRKVRLTLARLNAFVQEHVTGMSLVQLYTQEEATFGKFEETNRRLRSAHFSSIYYYATFFPAVEIIGALSVGIVLYAGGIRINESVLTFGELVAFIHLVERFYRPIRDLSEKYNILQASMASSERIFKLLDTEPTVVDPLAPRSIERFSGKIEIENLWFAYSSDEWVLEDVSFTVEPGEKVAIVGATGAGKTSLVSLIYRFYDYQRGSIRIDGVPITELPIDKLRSHLCLTLQDVFLFSGSYASNVRLRNTQISDRQVSEALKRVGFDLFLDASGDSINSEVRERGAGLSTGQKQLLSFARALAFDPDILVLDEATSSVDTHTEQLIQKALDELLKGRTSIIIAHRLSTIEKADKIVVLHHGRLREIGTHQQLLQQKGIYYKLYLMQYRNQVLSGSGQPTVAEQ